MLFYLNIISMNFSSYYYSSEEKRRSHGKKNYRVVTVGNKLRKLMSLEIFVNNTYCSQIIILYVCLRESNQKSRWRLEIQ